MSSKPSRKATVKRAAPTQNTYREWLALVAPEEREALGDALQSIGVKDYSNFTSFCQRILAELISGKIDPNVADSARGWAELMFTALAAENAASGTPGHAFIDIVTALNQATEALPAPQPTYITAEKVKEKVAK